MMKFTGVTRLVAIIVLMGFLVLYVPFSALYRSDVPQQKLEQLLERELSTLFSERYE